MTCDVLSSYRISPLTSTLVQTPNLHSVKAPVSVSCAWDILTTSNFLGIRAMPCDAGCQILFDVGGQFNQYYKGETVDLLDTTGSR